MTGKQLRRARLAAGLTQAQLARTLGRSLRMINGYESGEYLIPQIVVYAVELGFGAASVNPPRPTPPREAR